MLTILAFVIICCALAPWSTDLGADAAYLKLIGRGVWGSLVRIGTAPFSDWRAALDRFSLAVGIVLLVASFWSPLPASTSSGTHEDLKQAIEQYQSAHGLGVDGVWGPATNRTYLKGL